MEEYNKPALVEFRVFGAVAEQIRTESDFGACYLALETEKTFFGICAFECGDNVEEECFAKSFEDL